MSCCGSRAKRPAKGQAPAPVGLPGADGLVKLEYLGKEVLNQPEVKTGTRYRFGPDKLKGYVDKEDAAILLELSKNGNTLFRKLSTLNVPLPLPEVSSVIKGIGAEMVRKKARGK
jgi:hypothetical protein